MSDFLLKIDKLAAGYGGHPVLKDVSLSVPYGQRIGMIGPNGCGKSTLLRALVAEIPESNGDILFCGKNITHLETNTIVDLGVAYLRQTRNVFPSLSVEDNLELAAMNDRHRTLCDRDMILQAFPALQGNKSIRAGLMSGGERQALAVAMVLMQKVSLLLLDEPLAGLSRKSADELLGGIDQLQQEEGFAVIMVEHRLKLIHPYVDRVVVMTQGQIAEDTSDTGLLENREKLGRFFLA